VNRLNWHAHCLVIYDEPMTRDAGLYDYARFLWLNGNALYNRAWNECRGWFALAHESYLIDADDRFPFSSGLKEPPAETESYRRYRWRTSSAAVASEWFSEVARQYPNSRLAPWALFMAGKSAEGAQLVSEWSGLRDAPADRGQRAPWRKLVAGHPKHPLAPAARKRLRPALPAPRWTESQRERAQWKYDEWRAEGLPALREALGSSQDATLYERGLRAFYEYRVDDAAKEFEKLRRRFPNSRFHGDATFLLGLCHRERDEATTMEKLFREYVSTQPDTFAAQGMREYLRRDN